MKKFTSIFLILITIINMFTVNIYADTSDFTDVPKDHWSYEYVIKIQELNITKGIGNNKFGLGQDIKRAEFVTFLCKLLNLKITSPSAGSFTDNTDTKAWYYANVETALANGIITKVSSTFRPLEPITREEMAVMIIRSLSLDELAKVLDDGSAFSDVIKNKGYILIAKDLGIISGVGDNKFSPNANATREQAAAMMIRLYNLKNNKIKNTNGFYAIKSAGQQDIVSSFDYISYGWSRLETGDNDIFLNITAQNNNEYRIPAGFETPLASGKNKMLMVAVKESDSSKIINDSELRVKSIEIISDAIKNGIKKDGKTLSFDGVVIDFETLRGSDSKSNFNLFLKDLRSALGTKKIFTAVHPQRKPGIEYYNGYDYKTIGEYSDKVILMAHDYNAKKLTPVEMEANMNITPLAPINEVYYALKYITDDTTGVMDRSKIMLQISFDTCQWKIKDNKVINTFPFNPDYDTLVNRMASDSTVEIKYSKTYESPYLTFHNTEDATDNVIWYEDTRSVNAKINLAKLFNVTDISVWRLGTIPDYDSKYYLNVKDSIFKK